MEIKEIINKGDYVMYNNENYTVIDKNTSKNTYDIANTNNTKSFYNVLHKNLHLVQTKKSLVIVISIMVHGNVELIKNNNNKYNLSVKKFPNNFKSTFWKNIGVCGKRTYTKSSTQTEPIHKAYVDAIIQKKNLKYAIPDDITNLENNYVSNILTDTTCSRSPVDGTNQDVFYEVTNDDNNIQYKCNDTYKPFLNRIYHDKIKYLNKIISFTNKNNNPNNALYISIIIENETKMFKCINITELVDVVKYIISSFIIQETNDNYFDILPLTNSLNALSNPKVTDPEMVTLSDIFELLSLIINYDIELYLLDYSCSSFKIDIGNTDFNKILFDQSIAQGGNIQFNRKKKTKRRKISTNVKRKRNYSAKKI